MSSDGPLGIIAPAHTLDSTLGSLLIGVFISTALWGVSCIQLYNYFLRYRHDPLWIKLVAVVTWLLDLAHEVMNLASNYNYLVTQYGHIEALEEVSAIGLSVIAISAVSVFLVQLFFILRIWILSKATFVAGALVILSLSGLVMLCFFTSKLATDATFTQTIALTKFGVPALALQAAGDLLITVVLMFILQRSRMGISQSESMISRMMAVTMGTGLLTSLFSIGTFTALVRSPIL